MDLHENIIFDLLPGVRSGQASAETRALVETYLSEHPGVARLAAMMPTPDPALELRALKQTRQALGRATWQKALALVFTFLPLSFVIDEHGGFRFLFADYPGVIVGMAVTAAAFWARYFLYSKRAARLR